MPSTAPAAPAESQQRLHDLEQQFLTIDGGLDHPDRRALWPELASINAELGNTAEAALCWTHALWDQAEPNEGLLRSIVASFTKRS